MMASFDDNVNPVIRELTDAFWFRTIWPVTIVPAALRVIPIVLGIVTGEDQLQVPAGTRTVSPLLAELTADWTAACEQDAALRVAASEGVDSVRPESTISETRKLKTENEGCLLA